MSDQENSTPAAVESPEWEIKEPIKPAKPLGTKFSIWPPTQRTRDAVIRRLIETLTSPSILSKRYGTIPTDEAGFVALSIEEEAYAITNGSPATEDDGFEILQVYSKEISKRMLEAVKGRVTSPVVAPNDENPTSRTEN